MDFSQWVKDKKVLAIMGPTASGKTGLALALAQRYPLEIISVDSALIYRGMDIGTAKPSEQELVQVPHHLIDILDPDQRYSAADFVADCKALVAQIHQRGRLPVLVGGTMMYFHALQQGLADLPSADDALRARLMLDYQRDSQAMHDRLACVDPQSAQRIHANDPQRLIRALEIYHLTGEPLSVLQARQVKAGWDVKLCKLALIPQDRQRLHQRIAQRLEQMFAQDFINEVALLYSQPGLHADLPSIRCVGYRQVWDYLRGEYDQRTAFEKSLVATRQLAKRQLTWLRKEQDVVVIDPFVLSQAQQLATIESLLNLGE